MFMDFHLIYLPVSVRNLSPKAKNMFYFEQVYGFIFILQMINMFLLYE